jgi:hypothetical protein
MRSLPYLLFIASFWLVYVSIHSKDFPNGEIRGNSFVGIDRIFPDFTDIKWK